MLSVLPAVVHADEVAYPSDSFAKLDTFEAVAVEDADKLFSERDYPGAYAAYRAYSIEFANGQALPYVLLRMGRCLHLAGKRNTAIKAYQDVVDYFPDDVRYAAAAMYYIGQSHAQNGNEDQSLAVWAKMVKDDAYVGEANSGSALIALAAAMQARGDHGEAATYQWRTAVAFRQSNRTAADQARSHVVTHYVTRSPSQEKLLAFCNEVGGFGWHGRIDKPEDSPAYWKHIFDVALKTNLEEEKRAEICQYWDVQMGDRFADNDALRVTWFAVRLAHDKEQQAWAERMDTQFKLQPVTIARVRHWLSYFGQYPETRSAFFEKYGTPLVGSLENIEKIALIRHISHSYRMNEEAAKVLGTVRTDDLDDPALRDLSGFVATYQGEEAFLRTVAKIKDTTFASRVRFDHYFARSHRNRENQDKALAEVAVLRKSPDHAEAIAWNHAILMHHHMHQYEEAIKLYQATNNEPSATWAIIECHIALQQYAKAIGLCGELEALPGEAARACFKAADIYRVSGDKAKEVQQLQLVLRRYPKSSQSSEAHGRLESYGVKLIGGESDAEE